MNDQNRVTELDSPSASPAQSRCDNYQRYLEDAYGYAYSARDIVAVETLERHDHLASSATPEDLEGAIDELDDFERLGWARGRHRDGDLEAFCEQIEILYDSEDDHPAVAYPELPLLAALVLRAHDEFARAQSFLERGRERWPEATVPIRQQEALVALETEGREAAQHIYQSLADDNPDDPELRFEIAEDLREHGAEEMAREWAERAESAAERLDDRPLLVDVRLLKQRLSE